MTEPAYRLTVEQAAALDLPTLTLDILVRGFPTEVAEPSGIMPTVFTPAVSGTLRPASPGGGIDGYVFGSIRERHTRPAELGWFVLERLTGRVFLTAESGWPCFANSDLGSFIATLQTFAVLYAAAADDPDDSAEAGERYAARFEDALARIDPPSLAEDSFWSSWVDEFRFA